jgi:phosphoglycerate kinase
MNFNRLKDCVVTNKNVILRVDINVPIKDGIISDDTRIKAIIPTIKYLVKNKAKVILMSHFGRPKGEVNLAMSLGQLVQRIEKLSGIEISFVNDCIGDKVKAAIKKTNYGEVILLENLRFYEEETDDDRDFAKELAAHGNLYINDAFSCCHRAHASITGIPQTLKSAAGFLLESELDNLTNLVANPKSPMIAVVGGSKVSTKIELINSLITKADAIVIAGGMANTFLFAQGHNIAKSLCEKELRSLALAILAKAKKNNCEIILPSDVRVCKVLENNTDVRNIALNEIQADDIIADIGIHSTKKLADNLESFKTIVWNGPLGAFEYKPFDEATNVIAQKVAQLTDDGKLISVAGGGDVVSAINKANLADKFSYISMAGGAFLEWLEGKSLPGIKSISKDEKNVQNG